MINYSLTYTIRKEFSNELLNKIKKIIFIANKNLNLKSKNNFFEITIVADKKIKSLNNKYRYKDKITDVISLAYNPPFEYINKEYNHLGEIYLDFNQAVRQAKMYGHSLDREICFLILHGLLHLIGFDHLNINDEKVMFG